MSEVLTTVLTAVLTAVYVLEVVILAAGLSLLLVLWFLIRHAKSKRKAAIKIAIARGNIVRRPAENVFSTLEPRGSGGSISPSGTSGSSGSSGISPWGTSGSSGSLPSQRWGPGRNRRYG